MLELRQSCSPPSNSERRLKGYLFLKNVNHKAVEPLVPGCAGVGVELTARERAKVTHWRWIRLCIAYGSFELLDNYVAGCMAFL